MATERGMGQAEVFCTEEAANVERILAVVAERTGVAFPLYRRATMERRIRNRMLVAGVEETGAYLERLLRDSGEAELLLERLTIKVSRFYRDPAVFNLVRHRVLPALLAAHPGRPLRVWSAGCARGEEAYTLAMLLAEAEESAGVSGSLVVATDIDESALADARRGVYAPDALVNLPSDLQAAGFDMVSDRAVAYRVRDHIRQRVVFTRHDLTGTRPPDAGPFDLVLCRNVLIYLERVLRARVQRLLHESLVAEGYLCLGEAEWLLPAADSVFTVMDHRVRIFRRGAYVTKG